LCSVSRTRQSGSSYLASYLIRFSIRRLHILFTCLDFLLTHERKRRCGDAGIRRGKLANYYLRYASNPSKCPAREALLLENDTGKGKGWFRIMEERVTLLHRTHVFTALYCITCVVCNFDNVCLITCLQPQLIPCRQNDGVTPSQSSFRLSYMISVCLTLRILF